MWTVLKSVFGGLFGSSSGAGGQSIVGQALDIAKEKVLDTDKLCALLADVIKTQILAESNPTWTGSLESVATAPRGVQRAVALYILGDAVHKLARTALWLGVVVAYVTVSVASKQPMDINTLMMLSAGPGLYTLMKGAGRK